MSRARLHGDGSFGGEVGRDCQCARAGTHSPPLAGTHAQDLTITACGSSLAASAAVGKDDPLFIGVDRSEPAELQRGDLYGFAAVSCNMLQLLNHAAASFIFFSHEYAGELPVGSERNRVRQSDEPLYVSCNDYYDVVHGAEPALKGTASTHAASNGTAGEADPLFIGVDLVESDLLHLVVPMAMLHPAYHELHLPTDHRTSRWTPRWTRGYLP